MVEFISYDGRYPCLCFGTLGLKINGKAYYLKNVLISGGSVTRDKDWGFNVTQGEWELYLNNYPELKEYEDEIVKVVNENIPFGCCGGCI